MSLKLPIFKYILSFFLIQFFLLNFNSKVTAAWVKFTDDREPVYEMWTDPNYGKCFLQTAEVTLQNEKLSDSYYGKCTYEEYKKLDPDGVNIFKNFCASVNPCTVKQLSPYTPYVIYNRGPKVYLVNDEGSVSLFELHYRVDSIDAAIPSNLGGADSWSVVQSYDECKAKSNYKPVVGVDKFNKYKGTYDSIDDCKRELEDSLEVKIDYTKETSGNCEYFDSYSARSNTIAGFPDTVNCICAARRVGPSGPQEDYSEIYIVDSEGRKKIYYETGGSKKTFRVEGNKIVDKTAFPAAEAKQAALTCLAENKKNYYYNSSIGGCYSNLDSCKNELECTSTNNRDYRYKSGTTTEWLDGFDIFKDRVSSVCSGKTGDAFQSCMQTNFKRCDCSFSYNLKYDWLLCSTVGIAAPGKNCDVSCLMLDVDLTKAEPTEINNPLALFRVVSNFLFWIAVILFILNFLTAGLEYVRSSEEPEKLKEATTRLTNTLFGLIFILIVGGLLSYLITLFEEIVR